MMPRAGFRTVRVRATHAPTVGEIVTIKDKWQPDGPQAKWVVIGYDNDDTVYEFENFTDDEGGPELRPETFKVELRKLP
jgi:hypothetical protein